MTRSFVLGAAALACFSATAHAQSAITGGGTAITNQTYPPEFSKFNPGSAAPGLPAPASRKATFSTYWAAGSGIGQLAFLSDDLSCDIDAVTGQNGGNCTGDGGAPGNTVSYGASDATLNGAQISSWATSTFGQQAAGNLIQLPSMGVGVAIPVVNPSIRKNGAATLSDNDLCGIFSGLITDFSQITDSRAKLTPGPFEVVFASGGDAGTTFWLTNHLAAVCTNGNSAITFSPTSDFASLFPDGTPANFVGATEGRMVASTLAGCFGPVPLALGYVTPDYTTIDPKSGAVLACSINPSNKSPLVVAGLFVGTTAYTPTVTNIAEGLTHPVMGQQLMPPDTAQQGANPVNWVSLVQTVGSGYPVVGYTSFDFAQCYGAAEVASGLKMFLRLHYANSGYAAIEHANGFATLNDVEATGFEADILTNMLADKQGWHTDIGDVKACKGLAGR
jgi:phosphate transport system substrate-binding protein